VAHAYALKNLGYNKKISNVVFYEGDVRTVVPDLKMTFDRIVMPLPKSAEAFLGLALQFLQRPGWLHFYDLQEKGGVEESIEKIRSACRQVARPVMSAEVTICGHCAPRLYRICVDARVG
jgi:tRNA (guanine37-N1)-methyltransferase